MSSSQVLMSGCWVGLGDSGMTIYQCPLAETVQGVARSELREDEGSRAQALRQLQDWISKNRDLHNCRTDHGFLLRFLRVKKFSVPMAQQMLLKYLNMRQSLPHLMLQLDCLNPAVDALIDSGYIFVSPVKDRFGRRVIITIPRNFDSYKYNNTDMSRVHMVTYETLLEDEENQVLGFTHVADVKGVSAALATIWSPLEFSTAVRWGEQSVPMRHKEIHVVHIPPAVRYISDFAITRLSNKLRDRFMTHDSFEELQEKVPRDVLPKEMGGDIPMRDMIVSWKKELREKRDRLLSLDEMRLLDTRGIISSSKAPPKTSKKSVESSICGSFRKLEVD